jgi:hypothetical protein
VALCDVNAGAPRCETDAGLTGADLTHLPQNDAPDIVFQYY